MIILDINLHNCYDQEFLGAEGGAQNFKIFLADVICTRSLVCRRKLDLDVRDDRSVRSALFISIIPSCPVSVDSLFSDIDVYVVILR